MFGEMNGFGGGYEMNGGIPSVKFSRGSLGDLPWLLYSTEKLLLWRFKENRQVAGECKRD